MHRLLWIVAFLLGFFSSVAYGEMFCGNRAMVFDRLASEYGEELVETKMIEDQGLLELLASPVTGTWTLLLTNDSVSCVMAVGDGLKRQQRFT